MNNTIRYYNENAEKFKKQTINADMTIVYQKFLKYVTCKGSLLDLGCGIGRDVKYFMEKGYAVTAIDGSEELCKIAKKYTGIDVMCKLFQEIDYNNEFNGIWACSSLLHVKEYELIEVLKKLHKALKNNGVLYMSFKYGNFSGERNGRYFLDMNEHKIYTLLDNNKLFAIKEIFKTNDARIERKNEKWLNVILFKI
ncbi:class I SAM-dependent methyltransferase [Clostridium sp. MD294]|uniref:class I SAM-dependent methyltransferase n=1 Tax=Clostridium sp. MD294 TaxID=97138 RepID=UPI0002C8AD6C|nr:class I SAM-dependent methyltransferase [Clostridium sp. MD294]NDO45760.1 class I SAM-dependent methyltransferase [Clostridium sp. MD294]USF30586.1 hypothetical protein C820_002028 [Clostridium sp. MD294]